MALKGDRKYNIGVDIHYFMNETAERGVVVTHSTSASGAFMDDANAVVKVPTGTGDGVAAGLLLNDMVNLDLTRQHVNWHQDEVQLGGKVAVLHAGEVTTNKLKSGDTPAAGDSAYFDANGELTTSAGSAKVGRFLGSKDEDGYVKVHINIS